MKDFLAYTGLRMLLFVVCYGVFVGLWALVFGESSGLLVWPFVVAMVLSSVLSWKYLRGPRERFARNVEARAARASARFEEMKAREDADQEV